MSLDTLDITLSRIIYHNTSQRNRAGVKYLIARTSSGATIKGEMSKAIEGERYRLWGEWRLQKPYKGRPAEEAFEFQHHEVIIDQSESGISHYLRTHVDGLGMMKSAALVAEFGTDTLTILRTEPERAATVKGITPEIVESIRKHFAETHIDPMAYAKLVDMFAGYKIPKKVISTLAKDFGSDAPQMIQEKPYLLLAFPRLGWQLVDSFATATAGYPKNGTDRHKAAIVEALERISAQGHTYGTRVDIETIAFGLIDATPTGEAWDAALNEDLIVSKDQDGEKYPAYCLPKLADAEETIAERLATLAATANPLPFTLNDDGLLEGQRNAIRLIEQYGVVILAGAPGTGKTYTITRALSGLVENGITSIKFVAPTGKAAKRAAELLRNALPNCPIEPSTIHRALAPQPSSEAEGVPQAVAKMGRGREEFGFGRGPDSPIEASIIVVDECSMVDAKLGASLFNAVANGSRLIIVGDPNQLPSVGAGSVLRDLIEAGVPTATLTEVQRNSGRIVRACHAILGGQVPEPAAKLDLPNGNNWVHLEISDPSQIAAQIVRLHESARKNGNYNPEWDMQVISPEKRKPGVGCNHLNRLLAELLNPYRQIDPAKVTEDDMGAPPPFERGDKVIRTKNGLCDRMAAEIEGEINGEDADQFAIQEPFARSGVVIPIPEDAPTFRWDGKRYGLVETDIVNGDMGTILDICKEGDNWYVVVRFHSPDRLCRLPYGECHLELAYAVTCHKAQGSGFKYVIVPVHDSFYYNARTGEGLWNREMIYTLLSRAETLLVTVGTQQSIRSAVGRKTVGRRRTRLAGLMRARLAAGVGEWAKELEGELVSVQA